MELPQLLQPLERALAPLRVGLEPGLDRPLQQGQPVDDNGHAPPGIHQGDDHSGQVLALAVGDALQGVRVREPPPLDVCGHLQRQPGQHANGLQLLRQDAPGPVDSHLRAGLALAHLHARRRHRGRARLGGVWRRLVPRPDQGYLRRLLPQRPWRGEQKERWQGRPLVLQPQQRAHDLELQQQHRPPEGLERQLPHRETSVLVPRQDLLERVQ
mmetsp:Transcript_67943/g.152206  ORF Transcript_67943/g.152206 Transcript_67943/m.152206 type:complete len:213 (-) Transcript_67943:327-965(-)